MAKSVTVNVVSQPLSRAENGVFFEVKEGEAFFGQLVVSKGGLRWRSRSKRGYRFISWQDLDAAAPDYPKG